MRAVRTARRNRIGRHARHGWTFIELLTSLAILGILFGAVFYGGRLLSESRKSAAAKQELKLLATAIEAYASFWPQWKLGTVVVAEKGWPDFCPGREFATCPTYGPYEAIAGFNDSVDFGGPGWIDASSEVLETNTTLAFALRARSGKGPYLPDAEGLNFVSSARFAVGGTPVHYPAFCGVGAAKQAEVIVDPWETPVRYFWVYRDGSRTSYRGYLPVHFAPLNTSFPPDAESVFSADFDQPAWPASRQIAAGYVLESAGPDKKFGNVWKINPTQAEIDEAADNVTITP